MRNVWKTARGKDLQSAFGAAVLRIVRLGYRRNVESTKKKSKRLGKYDTSDKLGVKRRMDVKYVPKVCYAGKDGEVFFNTP